MDKNNDGIWIIDPDAKTVYASEQMAKILGTTQSEMFGSQSFSYLFPEDLDAAQHLFNTKKRGDNNAFRFRLRRKDGSAVWVDVQPTPIYNAAGIFNGIIGTFTPHV